MADFGTDLFCVNDCTPDMAEVSGRQGVSQAIARRLITPLGRLIDDPNYGFDLTQYVNDDLSNADLARIQSGAEAECLKDERVDSATVTISTTAAGVMLVTVVLEDAAGPFTLTLAVTEVTAQLLKVS